MLQKEYIPDAWETVACPFCNSANGKPYEKFGSKGQYQTLRCSNCQLIYLSPRPKYDQHFIDAAYSSYYQYVDNLLLNEQTIVKHSSIDLFKKEMDYIGQFDKLKTAVLDIGSGMGTFLYVARQYYPEVVGLDVSEKMAAFVEKQLGVKVYLQQFQDFDYPKKFSLVHMSHVLEHIPNPNAWLQKAKSLLEKDGILIINVPNKFSFGRLFQHFLYKAKLKKQFSASWKDPARTPDHLFEPTIPAMKYLLKKNGYCIIKYYTYSRKDPASTRSFFSKFFNRYLKTGSNLAFITSPE